MSGPTQSGPTQSGPTPPGPNLACLCGQIAITLARAPDHINACNCTLCRKTGAHWAYFAPDEVTVRGTTHGFCRTDKADPAAEIHACPTCGTTSHFVLTPATVARFGNGMVGVNMLLADEAALTGIELRYPDGRAWSGDGPFGYVRPATIIGQA